jgi:hypothetical protein
MPGHAVEAARDKGWGDYKNGRLLAAVEAEFEVLLTVDGNIEHQQNLSGRKIAVVVLAARSNRLADHVSLVPDLLRVLEHIQPGQIVTVTAPPAPP